MKIKNAEQVIDKYNSEASWLVMILQDIQQEYNYLPEPILRKVAERLDIPLSRVHSVATFYSSLSLTERGKHIVRACDGTACHLKGFGAIRDEMKRHLGIEQGQTTEDKMFTFEVVACLGACALAPVISVDEKCYGKMNPEKVRAILDAYKKQ